MTDELTQATKAAFEKAFAAGDTEPNYVDANGNTTSNHAYNERVRIEQGGDPKDWNAQSGETYLQERARLAKTYGIDDPYTAGVELKEGAAEGYPPGTDWEAQGVTQNPEDTTHLEDN